MLALGATVGCGSSSTRALTATSCGVPYTFSVPGHAAIETGSCAGLLSSTALSLTVRRGQRFSVQIMHEQDGRLIFPIPTPTTFAIRIASQHGASVTYQAVATGTAVLLARHTPFCSASDPKMGSCPVLAVHVTP
jgi:hypothetical protein